MEVALALGGAVWPAWAVRVARSRLPHTRTKGLCLSPGKRTSAKGPTGPNPSSAATTAPCKVVTIDLHVFGQPLTMTTAVPEAPMRLADVVPLAWSVSDQLVRRGLLAEQQAGHMPPCRRGCAACCRYAVPLSVPEAFRLLDDVAALPPERRTAVEATFDAALRQMLQAGPPPGSEDTGTLQSFAQWYASIGIACPFLAGQVCHMYPFRPTACREHMVTSPPALCRDADPAAGSALALPFSLAHALGVLAAELEGTEVESILLPTALPWSADHAARSHRRWPGPAMVEHFAAILRRLSAADRPSAADAA
jgi:Fe-S-cluster containining protein